MSNGGFVKTISKEAIKEFILNEIFKPSIQYQCKFCSIIYNFEFMKVHLDISHGKKFVND
ncbi:hypothetical protein M0R19_05355 [Candidatus Pacearchaeota archaeon]|jgi:redox-regulated HSP33 family molecular chaperone|nr:hypothetical protein [Candidatus Pacearchaeota archaeon]